MAFSLGALGNRHRSLRIVAIGTHCMLPFNPFKVLPETALFCQIEVLRPVHWFYHSSVKRAVPIVPARVLICTQPIDLELGTDLEDTIY